MSFGDLFEDGVTGDNWEEVELRQTTSMMLNWM
jgi:hypothetical protein